MASNEFEMLTQAVKGKSDKEILQAAEAIGGIETLLDRTFEGMKDALDPDSATDSVIGYELSHDGKNYSYAVVVQGKSASIEKRDPSDARVTLQLSVPNYLRLITGDLNAMKAFMTRKLKVKGDLAFAQQIQKMFSQR